MKKDNLKLGELFDSDKEFKKFFDGDKDIWNSISRVKTLLENENVDENGNFINPNAKVHSSAVIKNSYIADDAQIYEFVNIRDSFIGPKTVVGHCNEIARSILLSECSVSRFVYIGSSIIGNKVNFGACCALASKRFDESNVFIRNKDQTIQTGMAKFGSIIGDRCLIGFGTHCNPGTVIGKDCIIMPHVEVRGVIPPESIVSVSQRMSVLKKRNVKNLGFSNLMRPV